MKFKNPMLVVTDIEKAKEFYKEVLGLRTIMDFGANVTLYRWSFLHKQQKAGQSLFIKEQMKLIFAETMQNFTLRKMSLTVY